MRIPQYYSQKISVLSFIAIVMVIYIHSYYREAQEFQISNKIQLIVSGLTSLAVPLFYTISGYFFFYGMTELKDCVSRIRKRFKSLLVPYIIWNLVFLGWYVALSLIPSVSSYVNSNILGQIDWRNPLSTLGYLFVKPVGFHLWFLRDLLLFVFASPLLYVLIKELKWWAVLLVFIFTGWMTRFWLSFFLIGGIMAFYYDIEQTKKIDYRICIITSVVYIGNTIIKTFFTIKNSPDFVSNYTANLSILVGIIAVWTCYDYLYPHLKKSIVDFFTVLSGYGFFIYLFHEPFFNIIKKLTLQFFGYSEVSLICCYLLNPLLMCFIAISVARVIKSFMPSIYRISVGGRVKS